MAQSGLQVAGHPKKAPLSISGQRLSGFFLIHVHGRLALPPCKKSALSVHFVAQIGLQVAGQASAFSSFSQRSSGLSATHAQVLFGLPSSK
jgi:hypothetical protein